MAASPSRCSSRPSRAPGVALVLLLALSAGAQGNVLVRHHLQATPSAVAVPVTLAAGGDGITTLGTSNASALTSYTPVPLLAAEVLAVTGGAASWSLRVEATGVTGAGALDSFTLQLCDPPALCADQVRVVAGSIVQSTGTATTLAAGESDVYLNSLATKVSGGTTTLSTHLVLTPDGGSGAEVRLPFAVAIG